MMAMTVAASASSRVSNRCWHRLAVARVQLYSARRTTSVASWSPFWCSRVRARYVSSGRWSRAASTTSSRLWQSLRHLCLDAQALSLALALGAVASVAHWCRGAANGEAVVVADIERPLSSVRSGRSSRRLARRGLRNHNIECDVGHTDLQVRVCAGQGLMRNVPGTRFLYLQVSDPAL